MKHSILIHGLIFVLPMAAFAQAKQTAITNVRIEIGDGRVIEHGTVVIYDGKVVSVGTHFPTGATSVDGNGGTLYPGFIDGYTSRGVSLSNLPGNVGAAPETRTQAPPTMWEGNRKGIHPQSDAAANWKVSDFADYYKQGLLAGLVAPGSGILRGTASVCEYRKTDQVLMANTGMDISTRSVGGGGGGTSQGYPQTLLGVVALCRQVLYDAQTYGQQLHLGATPKKDDCYEALQPVLNGQQAAVLEADSDREIFRSLNIADEFSLRAIIKGGRDGVDSAERLKNKNVALLLRMDYADAPNRVVDTKDPDATPKAVLEDRYKDWQRRMGYPKRYADQGVKFAFTSDGSLIDDYLSNVRRLVNIGGLDREVALKAMTSNAAAILGVSDKLGTIEPGKIANLVLMNGDFAKDGTAVQTVFVAGERIDVVKAK